MRAQDTGTLRYEVFLDAGRSEAVIIERYRDSRAVLDHLAHVGQDLMDQVMATGDVVREAFGRPSPELAAALAGSPVRLFSPLEAPGPQHRQDDAPRA